jgi:ribose transport system permease protein
MPTWKTGPWLSRFVSDYSMLLVLMAVCAYYSLATLAYQPLSGEGAGQWLADEILRRTGKDGKVLIAVRDIEEDARFAQSLAARLTEAGRTDVVTVCGRPSDVREALQKIADAGQKLDVIAANQVTASWPALHDLDRKFPSLGEVRVLTPPPGYRWPNFLKANNLLNIANQITVIAILAVGMTMVIIAGGIDLSVGSLIALSAVTATLLIRDLAGAEQASASNMILCCLAAIALSGLVGLFSGMLVTFFDVPPFIVTLGIMLVASGLAYIMAESQSIYQVPDTFVWLGRGADFLGIPNAVFLMGVLYVMAHLVMSRTTFGRYLYAVGGNAEAARLSGVAVGRIRILAYIISAALAGLGGVVMASQLKSGSPTYGQMYELYVIAAVVVGGTSLHGGEGKILGTLIGAFLIAVIQNGMNLTGVGSHPQRVVLGAVILGAVLLDSLKKRTWRLPSFFRRSSARKSLYCPIN